VSTYTDPAVNIRDEIALASGMPELPEKIWFHKTAAAVIDATRCVGCGGCIAACPSHSIGVGEDGAPTLVKMCTGCSACWDYCPMAGLRVERLVELSSDVPVAPGTRTAPSATSSETPVVLRSGHPGPPFDLTPYGADGLNASNLGLVRAAYSAQAIRKASGAQDGGVVTGLLSALLEAGEIDGAVVSRGVDAFHNTTFLATTVEEIEASAGSVYHQSHPLSILNDPLPDGVRRLAFVGTPCQVSVLRALQKYPWPTRVTTAGAVALTVALFCTRSFDPDRLEDAIAERGVDTTSVARLDIREGELLARDKNGAESLREPVKSFRTASLLGCDECFDFTGLSADIAIGNLASEPGRSTVLIRSEAGKKAMATASLAFTLEPLVDLGVVSQTAALNKKRAARASARGLDPDGPLWISYTEHLAAYTGTERAPKAPPAHRSYHFDVSC
jgi:coenzyme F420 hydrogenase subunit beta